MHTFFLISFLVGCDSVEEISKPENTKTASSSQVQSTTTDTIKETADSEPPSEEGVRTGEEVYVQVCQSCHMANGAGLSKIYPPLAGASWPMMEPSVPIRITVHGLMGEIKVKGETYNNVMAPWGAVLSDPEIANVLNHVRNSWGNSSSVTITAADVAEVRAKYDGHASWKSDELLAE